MSQNTSASTDGATDGTQSDGPDAVFSDALTGTSDADSHGPTASGTFPTRSATTAHTANTTAPDPETVRTLLNGVFADPNESTPGVGEERDENGSAASVTLADGGQPIQPVELPRDGANPGMLPPRRRTTWPARSRIPHFVLPRRGTWGLDRVRVRKSSADQPRSIKPSKGTVGVLVAFLLAVVFALVAIAFVSSFIGMFAGIGS